MAWKVNRCKEFYRERITKKDPLCENAVVKATKQVALGKLNHKVES